MFSFERGFGLWKIGGDVGVEILERGVIGPNGVFLYVSCQLCNRQYVWGIEFSFSPGLRTVSRSRLASFPSQQNGSHCQLQVQVLAGKCTYA